MPPVQHWSTEKWTKAGRLTPANAAQRVRGWTAERGRSGGYGPRLVARQPPTSISCIGVLACLITGNLVNEDPQETRAHSLLRIIVHAHAVYRMSFGRIEFPLNFHRKLGARTIIVQGKGDSWSGRGKRDSSRKRAARITSQSFLPGGQGTMERSVPRASLSHANCFPRVGVRPLPARDGQFAARLATQVLPSTGAWGEGVLRKRS
jgi:hypothetical protein